MATIAKQPNPSIYNLQAVETVLSGSAPLSPDLGRIIERLYLRPGVSVKQGWGMTETTCSITGFAPDDEDNGRSIGWLNPNCAARIERLEDRDFSGAAPAGATVGETWVAGPNIMKCYYKNPKATEEAIVVAGGIRWLRTGDIGYIDERGCIYILDRLKDLIKVKGLQVAPAELEQYLLTHFDVADAAVIGAKMDYSGMEESTHGGHSAWSTIGEEGIIIDLSHYADVHVDGDSKTARLVGGVLSKQVGVRLAEAGLFTALGNGNTVGAIPYFLGGGASITSSITGLGSDQIVSARVIVAKDGGRLVEVTEKEHPDLLWGLRGAGQFFGLVTQLTIRAHPFSLVRKQQGLIWTKAFIFPLEQAPEVVPVIQKLIADAQHATAGMMMIVAPPPTRTPSLVIAARYTGGEDPQVPFKPLYDLHPLVATGREVPIQNASDAREVLCAKGDFKQFGVVGLHEFDAKGFLQTIETWKKLMRDCPDAIYTGFNFQWDSRPVKTPEVESATSLHDIRYWQNNLIWHTEEANRRKVDAYDEECISIMRGGDPSRFVDFPNGTRSGPIERRYRGEARLQKLRKLKRERDAQGVFTRQLLE